MLSNRYICDMQFEISYTNQEITTLGGMAFLRQMLDKIEFKSQVENCIFYEPNQRIIARNQVWTTLDEGI